MTQITETPRGTARSEGRADHDARVYDDITGLLPSEQNPSPLVRINRLNPAPNFTLFAKLEWMNPFGSVKDRAASNIIRTLEEAGELRSAEGEDEGRGIVEPTSGNTGLSMAAIASARGYPSRFVVPNKVPLEKKVLLKIAGAELDVLNDELCPSLGMGDGSINLAKSHAKASKHRYTMPNQYENPANYEAHVRTTGPEIWNQTDGGVTHVFTSLGTCGTVTGLAKYLKERKPGVKVIAIQPSEGHDVPGLRNTSQLDISKLYDPELIDEVLEVDFKKAYTTALELSQREGLLAGPSSGLIFEGAREILLRDPDQPGVGVAIFCDNVFKYVSSMIKHIPELSEGTSA
ncbi:MAG: cysteine synthase family protein [Planctomycetota bacterium]